MQVNRERELLKRVFDTQHTLSVQIGYEIQELLAQPEHIPDVGNMVKQELFKPDWANYRQGVEDSKREPLSEGMICLIYDDTEDSVSFARLIEKAHGIG